MKRKLYNIEFTNTELSMIIDGLMCMGNNEENSIYDNLADELLELSEGTLSRSKND